MRLRYRSSEIACHAYWRTPLTQWYSLQNCFVGTFAITGPREALALEGYRSGRARVQKLASLAQLSVCHNQGGVDRAAADARGPCDRLPRRVLIGRIILDGNPPATVLAEQHELPSNEAGAIKGYGPRGMDIDCQRVVWVLLASDTWRASTGAVLGRA